MNDNYVIRHGTDAENGKLLDLLNRSFGFETEHSQFLSLLPKLYKDEYHPAANNGILFEGGEPAAAVGLFYNTVRVGDDILKVGGIGNVAVSPDHRHKDYMKACMNRMLEEMMADDADFSCLGGHRHRYAYFSYEPAGIHYSFRYLKRNLRHTLGCVPEPRFTAVKLAPGDDALLDQIHAIHSAKRYAFGRSRGALFDIMSSWHNIPYAVCDGDEVKGWFIMGSEGTAVTELCYKDPADIGELLISAVHTSPDKDEGEVWVQTPEFDVPLMDFLSLNGENMHINNSESYSIFNFGRFLSAFMKLRAEIRPLTDGAFTCLIHGVKRDENLRIAVKDNAVTVEETSLAPDIELSHHEAVRLFVTMYSERRRALPPECAAWFPLPVYTPSADAV